MRLQDMMKRDNETFKEYAQRWKELAAQIEPLLVEKEMIAMFIDTLQSPFYDRMIGSVSSNFSDIVIIREQVESRMRTGKIAHFSEGSVSVKRPPVPLGKKKEWETNVVMINLGRVAPWNRNQRPSTFQHFQAQSPPYPYIVVNSHHCCQLTYAISTSNALSTHTYLIHPQTQLAIPPPI